MSTAETILDAAEALIQEHGYSGFSFADVAKRVGIRKASIYYHFPAKAALGQAVIARYRARLLATAADLEAGQIDHWQALSLYLDPILTLGRSPDKACLCGVLGGEYVGLPEVMQAEVAGFFAEHLRWIEALLTSGRAAGAFRFEAAPADIARLMFSAIEGALLIKRTNRDTAFLDGVVRSLTDLLGGAP